MRIRQRVPFFPTDAPTCEHHVRSWSLHLRKVNVETVQRHAAHTLEGMGLGDEKRLDKAATLPFGEETEEGTYEGGLQSHGVCGEAEIFASSYSTITSGFLIFGGWGYVHNSVTAEPPC